MVPIAYIRHMDISVKQGYCGSLILSAVLLTVAACKIHVEKIKPFTINDQHFEYSSGIASWQDSVFVICCNGTVTTPSETFDKGQYMLTIRAKGSQAGQVYPLLKVRLNGKPLQDVRLDSTFTDYRLPFQLEEKKSVRIAMVFDQDAVDKDGHDRNVFIKHVLVTPSTNIAP